MDQTMQPLDKTNQPLDWINQTSGGGALNEVNRAVGRANQTEEEEAFKDAVVKRLIENIDVTKSIPDPQAELPSGSYIPQPPYCEGAVIPAGNVPQSIPFETANSKCFPAWLASAGQCDSLVDKDCAAFSGQFQTLSLRIEWPGYQPWIKQIRTVDYRLEPRSISREKLLNEVAKQLEKFIESNKSVAIALPHANFRVGPGGIELCHIYIASLDQASRGSWQPRLIFSRL